MIELYPDTSNVIRRNADGSIEFADGFLYDPDGFLNVSGQIRRFDIDIIDTSTQVISSTDQTITGPAYDSALWHYENGELESKKSVSGAAIQCELNTVKTGGSGLTAIIQIWGEASIFGGAWAPIANTLREFILIQDGAGNVAFTAGGTVALLPGIKFRIRIKNIGGGGVSLQSPAGTTTDLQAITGFSKKLTILS